MTLQELSAFLKKAKRNTYASEKAEKVASTRLGSRDYEFAEGNFLYHDTYFGGRHFIGEEIVYWNSKAVWGMNYRGDVLEESVTEAEIDVSLRGALKQDSGDLIPVRGPARYAVQGYEYTNSIEGDLAGFEGREEITKDSRPIYKAVFQGGLIH